MKSTVCILLGSLMVSSARAELVAHWDFEAVQQRDGSVAAPVAGQGLPENASVVDRSGKGNVVQASGRSPHVFSDNVPSSS
ncbi:MAG: hypothetical protein GXY61_08135, partial [Lentisphaerae bacterium]|nr:hypothetical protein [Lentisphaerota bacterium]